MMVAFVGFVFQKTLAIGSGGGGGRERGRSRNYVKSWTEDFFLCNATIHHFELALRILAVFKATGAVRLLSIIFPSTSKTCTFVYGHKFH